MDKDILNCSFRYVNDFGKYDLQYIANKLCHIMGLHSSKTKIRDFSPIASPNISYRKGKSVVLLKLDKQIHEGSMQLINKCRFELRLRAYIVKSRRTGSGDLLQRKLSSVSSPILVIDIIIKSAEFKPDGEEIVQINALDSTRDVLYEPVLDYDDFNVIRAVPNILPDTLGVGCHTFHAVLCVSSPEHGVVTLSANVMDEPIQIRTGAKDLPGHMSEKYTDVLTFVQRHDRMRAKTKHGRTVSFGDAYDGYDSSKQENQLWRTMMEKEDVLFAKMLQRKRSGTIGSKKDLETLDRNGSIPNSIDSFKQDDILINQCLGN